MFKNWVDVSAGKMTFKELCGEIFFWMYHKAPRRMVVDIRIKEDGYHVALWMSATDFKKPWQPPLPKGIGKD